MGTGWPKAFDIPALVVSSVVPDVQPFAVLVFNLHAPFHGFSHSLLGASLLAAAVAGGLYILKGKVGPLMGELRLPQESSIRKILWTALFGAYLHVLLDAPLYPDVHLFYPLQATPLYGLVSSDAVYLFCELSFVVGAALFLRRFFRAGRGDAGSQG